jgi:hypothetical protein
MCSSLLPLPSSAMWSSFNALARTPLFGLLLSADLLPHEGCMASAISGVRASDPKRDSIPVRVRPSELRRLCGGYVSSAAIEFAFASISVFLNHVQVQYESACGDPDIANVRDTRTRSVLGIGGSEQGCMLVLQNVLPPLARLIRLSCRTFSPTKAKVNIRAAIRTTATISHKSLRTDAQIPSRPVSHVPSSRYMAQHALPRASCRFILVPRTPVLHVFSQCCPSQDTVT